MSPYATAAAFKQALEARLRSASSTGVDFARRRQLLVFDRFLARIVDVLGDTVVLKGGLVVERRVERARTTKDIDLRILGSPEALDARLERAAALELGDFMRFIVAADTEHPKITNEGTAYEGLRYRVTCETCRQNLRAAFRARHRLRGPIFGKPDVVVADDVLGFASIGPPTLRLCPLETPPGREAARLHIATPTAELAREGSARHRVARRRPRDRSGPPSPCLRSDVHVTSHI